MMAERKRKQKWSLNPRGKAWAENSNKFGQKLMEKMGWTSGKGLGANEDGMTEHIRVSYKNDTQGMGFTGNDDKWTEHESNFTELLKTLNTGNTVENGDKLKVESLEKKSKVSRSRVHYHKFTRGKDLSTYSEKDLANIFGKKNLEELSKPVNVKDNQESEKENVEDKTFGVETHNRGSMLDYFKNKMPNFKSNSSKVAPKVTNDDSESEIERPSFGFGFNGNGSQNDNSVDQIETVIQKSKKNKDPTDNFRKPCFGLGYDRYNGDDSKPKSGAMSFVKATETLEKKKPLKFGISLCENSVSKSKSEESKENLSDNENSSVGFGFNTNSQENKIRSSFMSFVRGSSATETKDCSEKKEKSKKRKNKEEDCNNKDAKRRKLDESENMVASSQEPIVKKKDKKAKSTFVSFITENGAVESPADESIKKKKKSKKEKFMNEPNVDETVKIQETLISMSEIVEDGSQKKKKPKNKNEDSENKDVKNKQDGSENIVTSSQETAVKKKDKKAEPTLVSFTTENGAEENPADESIKKKKKSKKNKSMNESNVDETSKNDETDSSQQKKKRKNKDVVCADKDAKRRKLDESENNISFSQEPIAKTKDKKVTPTLVSVITENDRVENPADESMKKKKKSKKNKCVNESIVDETSKNEELQISISEIVEDSLQQKKKRKNKGEDCDDEDANTNRQHESENIVGSALEAIAKNKDKKAKSAFVPFITENGTDENAADESLKKKKKSKKEKFMEQPHVDEKIYTDKNEETQISVSEIADDSLQKKKKKKNKETKTTFNGNLINGYENTAFDDKLEESKAEEIAENKYEIKDKKRKKPKIENCVAPTLEDGEKNKKKKNKDNKTSEEIQTIVDETPTKPKKKKKDQMLSIENPCFDSNDSLVSSELVTPNKYEVKRSKKNKKNENKGIVNPGLDLTSPPIEIGTNAVAATADLPVMDDNLMLNVICTPIIKKDKKDKKLERRKSVRFSDVNQSIFINKTDSPADLRKNGLGGLDNAAYDQFGNRIEENIDTLNKQLDDYQAEVENDLNEAKMEVMVGEVGDPDGENEILPNGDVKLKFKYAKFGKMPPWMIRNRAEKCKEDAK